MTTVCDDPLGIPTEGLHILATFYECQCQKDLLYDADRVMDKLKKAVDESGLTAVNSSFFSFNQNAHDQHGYTGCIALAESHLALTVIPTSPFTLHSWPEINKANIQIFVCNYTRDNSDKARELYKKTKEILMPKAARYREVLE